VLTEHAQIELTLHLCHKRIVEVKSDQGLLVTGVGFVVLNLKQQAILVLSRMTA